MHTVIETPDYLTDARRAGLTEAEQWAIVDFLALYPDAGQAIPGTGGARKLRFAGRGKGKSGGYRVIIFYSGPRVPVFLLNVFAKGDKVDLTAAERNELRAILSKTAAAYLEGVRRNVRGR